MPFINKSAPKFVPSKEVEVQWDTFNGGLNTLFKPTELKNNELAQADNLMLVGAGTPTGRWGSQLNHLAGEVGSIRLLDAYYNSTASLNYLLAITDSGLLTYKSNASYTIVTGTSFASGYSLQSVELGNNTYIACASLPLVKFNGTNLIPYLAIGSPTNASVAQLSAASGFTTYSWLVTAVAVGGGETLPSVAKTLASMPLDLTKTSIKISWNTVSAASLSGYNVYRGFPGDETFLATTDPATTQYIDTGTAESDLIFPPLTDTTAGIRAKYILKFDDRTILAGIAGDPSKVYISGRYPYQDRYSAADGGGYVIVAPNDGDDITGLGIAGNQGMSSGGSAPPSSAILVMKNNSVHRVALTFVSLGNFTILDAQAQLLTSSNGCSSGDTVCAVENDTYYFGRKGLQNVGQEPNFLNQIRTNELSARIRNYVQGLSDVDFKTACAGYIDNKYLLAFPARKEIMIYDRERGAFMGPWKTPWGVTKIFKYIDPSGTEKWLVGTDNGGKTYELSASLVSDSGTAISKILRTKKEHLGGWSFMKVLKLWYTLFRNVRGNVTANLRLEGSNGITTTTKSFSISSSLGDGGWGSDGWGQASWGTSDATVVTTGDELVRWAQIFKTCRVAQVEIISTGASDNWEFLGNRFTAQPLGDNSLPSSTRT